jgi:NAD-dependent dihydropyrimidine dehydrogenase PreA subunit
MPKLWVDQNICMCCGACVGTCPQNALYLAETHLIFNENCNYCKLCIHVCPVGAILAGNSKL